MRRILEYVSIFLVLTLLQVFLFDNLNISVYLYPLVYVGFIMVLPMNINPALLLVVSMFTGAFVDFFAGTYGLNTIASLATGFIRPMVLNISLGKDVVREGGMPLPLNVGGRHWLRYAIIIISIHCIIYYVFETLTFKYIWFTFLRAAGSIISTTLILWFLAALFPAGKQRGASLH